MDSEQRARYRPQVMGQHEIATVQTAGATAYVNTCNFVAIDIYHCPADEELKNGRHACLG
jgi:hypothetical protein